MAIRQPCPRLFDSFMQTLTHKTETVWEARSRLLGDEHMDTLTAMSRLAYAYAGQKLWDQAITLQKTALDGWLKEFGEDHPETLTAMAWLAWTYWQMDQGRLEEAKRLYNKVLMARIRVLGESHPTTANTRKVLEDIQNNRSKSDGYGLRSTKFD